MAGLLKKAPWASKDQAQTDRSNSQSSNQASTLFSKAPWSSRQQDDGRQAHAGNGAADSKGSLFSKAPWASNKEDQPQETKEESLTTILPTREDRTNFLLLVAECTELMRKYLLATFDPNNSGEHISLDGRPLSPRRPDTSGTEKSVESEVESVINFGHEDPNIADPDDETRAKAAVAEAEADELAAKAQTSKEEKTAKEKAAAEEKARKELEQRVKEVNTTEMKELAKSSVAAFDDWSQRVLGRVGEAVNQTDDAEQVSKAQSTSKSSENAMSDQTNRFSTDGAAPDTAIHRLYPPIDTPFSNLDQPRRVLILHSMLLLMISLETYSSYSRVLLAYLASSLNVPIRYLAEDESKVAQGLMEAAKKQMNADEETKKKAEENVWERRLKVGLGTVAGAALIGVTGGLAAPLLAAGVGTVMGGLGLGATATATYLGAMAGSAPLVGALFGAYGGRMAGQMVDNYAKEINDFAFIPVHRPSTSFVKGSQTHPASSDRRLRVTIGVSGWLNDASDVVKPWQVLGNTGIEAFALRFELDALIRLGNALTTYVKSAAWGVGSKAVISQTVFATLAAGLWPLGIVKAARVVDNPFSVARSRSEKAGRVLADAIINKVQGERPVTLVGYSLGARVIYYCLDELSRRKAFGLIESVVLAGAAVPADSAVWRRIRSVVSGRVVNIFSTNDYLLGFLYRTASFQYGVAGLQAISGVANIENIDVSDILDGHTKYRLLTGQLLSKIGFEDIDAAAVAQQVKQLNHEEQKQEQERKEAEEKQQGKDTDEADVEDMEKEVEKKNEKSMLSKVGDRMSQMRIGIGDKITGRDRSRTPDGKTGSPKSDAGGERKERAGKARDADKEDSGVTAAAAAAAAEQERY